MLDGWQESRGVQAEIRIAHELGKPVRYLDPLMATSSPTLAHVANEMEGLNVEATNEKTPTRGERGALVRMSLSGAEWIGLIAHHGTTRYIRGQAFWTHLVSTMGNYRPS